MNVEHFNMEYLNFIYLYFYQCQSSIVPISPELSPAFPLTFKDSLFLKKWTEEVAIEAANILMLEVYCFKKLTFK